MSTVSAAAFYKNPQKYSLEAVKNNDAIKFATEAGDAVVLSNSEYEFFLQLKEDYEIEAAVARSEKDFAEGRYYSMEEVFGEIREMIEGMKNARN